MISSIFHSLRARLILIISGTLTVLLIVLFMVIATLARGVLIDNEIRNVTSITRTFSVLVLDIIISEASQGYEKEFILESYILDFVKKEPHLDYILLYDNEQNLVVTNDFSYFSRPRPEFVHLPVDELEVTFRKQGQWLNSIDCLYPLQTGKKNWGTLVMGFNARPLEDEIKALFVALTIVAILLVTVMQLLLYFLISNITRSLTHLAQVVEQMDFDSSSSVSLDVAPDEVGILAGAIGKLQQRLQRSKNEIIEVQQQVYHAEKLASIGRLASGVAHEINNPLQGIKNVFQTVVREPENRKQTREYLELAGEGLNSIETIVKKLLGYSRNQPIANIRVNVRDEVEKVLSLLEYKLTSKQISVLNQISKEKSVITGDPSQIQEVFMNLILNSIDALDQRGAIRLSCECRETSIKVYIHDNGTGISNINLDKIFDPFFTTKEHEMGTGLGLSVSQAIMESHGGSIEVTCSEGEGTTFTLTFPKGNTNEDTSR